MARKRASEVVAAVEQAAEAAIKKSAPAAKRVGKVATGAASTAAAFMFETTRAAVRKMPGRVFGPPCPRCGAKTLIRRNRQTGHMFAACSSWHDTGCSFTADVVFNESE